MSDVHTRHCCKRCGCKYRDPNCTVEFGNQEADYDCEECESRFRDAVRMMESLNDEERRKILNMFYP